MNNKDVPPPYQHHEQQPKPPYGFNQPPQPPVQHTQVVVTAVPTVAYHYGPAPVVSVCPYCHAQIQTRVETEANTKTHLFAFLLCIFGCWPCCCIPYCMDSCQSRNHFCPNCKAFLATYSD